MYPDDFSQAVPVNAIALVLTVVSSEHFSDYLALD